MLREVVRAGASSGSPVCVCCRFCGKLTSAQRRGFLALYKGPR